MRIIYLFNAHQGLQGVNKKTTGILTHLNKLGVEARGIFFTEGLEKEYTDEEKNIRFIPVKGSENIIPEFLKIGALIWPFVYYSKKQTEINQVLKALSEEKEFDLILMRYFVATPGLFYLMYKYPGKIIFEHNTMEGLEYQNNMLARPGSVWVKYNYYNDKIFGPSVIRRARGLTAITREVAEYELKRSGRKDIPALVSGNGIDVASVPVKNRISFDGKTLKLLALLGATNNWHGIDRVIRGMKDYSGNVEIQLFIAGEALEEDKKLVSDLQLEKQVFFLKRMDGTALDELVGQCHLAIGSLAIFRKQQTQNASLKVREYIARGIPFINGYDDADIDGEPEISPFIHKIPNSDEPLNIQQVVEFAERSLGIEDYPAIMRNFAFKTIDFPVKIKKLKAFLESLIHES